MKKSDSIPPDNTSKYKNSHYDGFDYYDITLFNINGKWFRRVGRCGSVLGKGTKLTKEHILSNAALNMTSYELSKINYAEVYKYDHSIPINPITKKSMISDFDKKVEKEQIS